MPGNCEVCKWDGGMLLEGDSSHSEFNIFHIISLFYES